MMAEESQQDFVTARKVLKVFSTLGFKKTSMEEIAKAAGVSRQSIYKKFGSKKACYAWVIDTYLSDIYSRAFVLLEHSSSSAEQTLMEVFGIIFGEAIEITGSAEGTAVLEDCLKAAQSSDQDWQMRFRVRLGEYLAAKGLVASDKAYGIAFVMMFAGKGLLLEKRVRSSLTKT